ncbi:PTS IIA-like nitrogen-regulatory protein PtsN [Oceanicola granulosus HTCC2516]|uniref:PTS IIA-like nitrogen-regulatory protein PtsN n=1 Tax=Oceanicola granulosus (strain ATCC BAA-861 / DSM 15982 / KCTC 12143 / HTCC2516) TaxID=314256 RepID=Q2CK08_OCEGH|nr:PTS sugar transporter subunit IIA [Oceanicola granulosus]EAR52981.1 PTS IIA-like nitrogen-regulatory protein PtsN [Oceanicola granulosus HTCC2516]
MQLADILDVHGVKVLASCSSRKRLFHDLGEMAHSTFGLEPGKVIEALLEREALGPTAVGHGVALPHARLDGIDRVRGLFLRLEKPLDFDAIDRQPVDLVFALLAPEAAGVEHLKALATVSRTLRDQAICAKLRANAEPATLHAILTEAPATQAA